jgi:hypothetical protein
MLFKLAPCAAAELSPPLVDEDEDDDDDEDDEDEEAPAPLPDENVLS